MDLGITIKRYRISKGMTQGCLCEKLSITQTYLSQVESNKKEPTLKVLKKISNVLDVPLPILMFLSLSDSDVSAEKLEMFKMLKPSIHAMIKTFFLT